MLLQCLILPELAESYFLPSMADMLTRFLQAPGAESLGAIYKECFLNVELVVSLFAQPPETIIQFVDLALTVRVP